MKRRDFITVLGGAAAWPLAARAQQLDRVRRLGILMPYAKGDAEGQEIVAALREGLEKFGWIEHRSIRIDDRWGGGNIERTQAHAAELDNIEPVCSNASAGILISFEPAQSPPGVVSVRGETAAQLAVLRE